jgi:hypothetical protein
MWKHGYLKNFKSWLFYIFPTPDGLVEIDAEMQVEDTLFNIIIYKEIPLSPWQMAVFQESPDSIEYSLFLD